MSWLLKDDLGDNNNDTQRRNAQYQLWRGTLYVEAPLVMLNQTAATGPLTSLKKYSSGSNVHSGLGSCLMFKSKF